MGLPTPAGKRLSARNGGLAPHGLPCPSPPRPPPSCFLLLLLVVSHLRAFACASPSPWELLLTYLERPTHPIDLRRNVTWGTHLGPSNQASPCFSSHGTLRVSHVRDHSILSFLGAEGSLQAGPVEESRAVVGETRRALCAWEAHRTCTPSTRPPMRQIHKKHISCRALETQQRMKEVAIPCLRGSLTLGQGRLRLEGRGGRSEGEVLWAEE